VTILTICTWLSQPCVLTFSTVGIVLDFCVCWKHCNYFTVSACASSQVNCSTGYKDTILFSPITVYVSVCTWLFCWLISIIVWLSISFRTFFSSFPCLSIVSSYFVYTSLFRSWLSQPCVLTFSTVGIVLDFCVCWKHCNYFTVSACASSQVNCSTGYKDTVLLSPITVYVSVCTWLFRWLISISVWLSSSCRTFFECSPCLTIVTSY